MPVGAAIFTPSSAKSAIMPPSPSLSMRIAKLTYLIVVMTNKVQRIRDNAPSVVAASGLAPVRLRTVFNV